MYETFWRFHLTDINKKPNIPNYWLSCECKFVLLKLLISYWLSWRAHIDESLRKTGRSVCCWKPVCIPIILWHILSKCPHLSVSVGCGLIQGGWQFFCDLRTSTSVQRKMWTVIVIRTLQTIGRMTEMWWGLTEVLSACYLCGNQSPLTTRWQFLRIISFDALQI